MNTPTSLFNVHWYLTSNPQLARALEASSIDPFDHFTLYGKYEGRAPGPLFNTRDYLDLNPDVAAAVAIGETTAYDHFIMHGLGEGRIPLKLFNEHFYLQRNPDVAEAVAAGAVSAIEHFILFGYHELRAISPLIDLRHYVAANPDVGSAVQHGEFSALEHLLLYGIREGRELGNGIRLADFSNDAEFALALADGNIHAALERVNAVAPFMPDFKAPDGWLPPADTAIPLDFTPPHGSKLVVPAGIRIPDGMRLPDTFEPVAGPPQSHGDDTSTGDNGAGRVVVVRADTDQVGTEGDDTFRAGPNSLSEKNYLDGRGGMDVLVLKQPNAPAWNQIKNIETLSIVGPGEVNVDAGAAGFQSVTASGVSKVCITDGEAGTLRSVTLENFAGSTATLTGNSIEEITIKEQSSDLGVALKNDQSTSLRVNIDGETLDTEGAAVTVKIKAGDMAQHITIDATGAPSHIEISAQAADTIALIGSGALSLSNIVSPRLSAIDGSSATGALTIDLTKTTAADTPAGGLTLQGGSNDDMIVLAPGTHGMSSTGLAKGYTLTGGKGNDTFDVGHVIAFNDAGQNGAKSVVNADFAVITTITDFAAGDVLKFDLPPQSESTKPAFRSQAIDVSTATGLTAALDRAANVAEAVTWFRYGSDTYVLVDGGTSNSFTRSDIIVKLTGHIDLGNAILADGGLSFTPLADPAV